MTPLKCLNSGVESNDAAFILSPSGYGFSFLVPGAYGKEAASSIALGFACQFLVSNSAAYYLLHNRSEALGVRSLAVVIAERLFIDVADARVS
jgi:hypothetical protein